jgi:hypothetical protein
MVSCDSPATFANSLRVSTGSAEFCRPDGPLPPPLDWFPFAFASISGLSFSANSPRVDGARFRLPNWLRMIQISAPGMGYLEKLNR